LGLISIGLLFFISSLNLFSKNTYKRHLIEIDRKSQPELFGIIDEIIRETKVSTPGKVFCRRKLTQV
jgi:hypothetical protein